MTRTLAAIICACVVATLAGCADDGKKITTQSLKQGASTRGMSAAERAQWARCGERHAAWAKGTLQETEEVKQDRDKICGALYRGS